MVEGKFWLGTSGWTYPHWKGVFYPEEVARGRWLAYYSEQFDTVELNASFYHLPQRKTFVNWRAKTPPGFLFSVKGSRYITHVKKLEGVEEPLARLLDAASALEEKLGPILFQLPPQLKCDLNRLEKFLSLLPPGNRYAFEFRNPTFFCLEVYELLRQKQISLCIADTPSYPKEEVVTASFVYLRLHGSQSLYTHCYEEEELWEWGKKIKNWLSQGEVFCYFDNDYQGFAIKNAFRLREIVQEIE